MKIGTSDLEKLYLGSAEVEAIYLGTDLVYVSHDYSQDYLTFVALENGTFSYSNDDLYYSVDDGDTWQTLQAGTSTPTITAGDRILWKANGFSHSWTNQSTFSSTGLFEVEGNIMSLVSGDSFSQATDIPQYTCISMFSGCTGLTTAEHLVLPSTVLSEGCYEYMFSGCTSLTTAPKIEITEVGNYSCYAMFFSCTSLTKAPKLSAMTVGQSCYAQMFFGCTSLTTAPELPATTLAGWCYNNMFRSCTGLTTAPELPATTLTEGCYSQMFYGCTSLTTAPELPATTLANSCYSYMFNSCTSLNSIKCLATDISATDCTQSWVTNVSATGTFLKDKDMADWTTGDDGIPSGWTVNNFGVLPDVPFLFNYNAKEYDATTYTLPQTDGQLIEQDAVIVGDYLSEITHNTDHITLPYRVQRAVIESQLLVRDSSNPTLTIITKAKTTGGHSVFANRASNYNYMYRQYADYLTLHGVSEQGRIAVDSTKPSVLSVRVDSNRTLTYNNWTDSTSSIKSGTFDYGGANSTAALFNGYASTWSEEWSGDFYWIYLSTETLTDEQIQQVIDYNENL